MTFWMGRFIVEWVVWLVLADKSRWKEIFPVCFFASLIADTFDLMNELFMFWKYVPNDDAADLVNSLGIYIVVTYLFIQYLPRNKSISNLFLYIFIWTIIVILFEFIHVQTGYMKYIHWNIGYSYMADWMLFFLFYEYYLLFQKGRSCTDKDRG